MSVRQVVAGSPERAAFRGLYRDTQARLFQRNVLVAASVYMAFACWDIVVAPTQLATTLKIRTFVLAICSLLFLASGVPKLRRFYNLYFVGLLVLASFGVSAILWVVPEGFAIGIAGVVICITASSVLFRATGSVTMLAGGLAAACPLALMVLHDEPDALIRSSAIFLVTAIGFAVLHSVQAERAAFDVYTAQKRLETEKARTEALLADLTHIRQERFAWLENLARFLRHELSNQIVAVSTSIDLARDDGSRFGTDTYLKRAQVSLGRMRGLVSSATEATSLESALAADHTERVDLSGVVIDRVAAFQQLHPTKSLTLKLRPGLFVEGHEERLAQLLDKLLGNAVEHARLEGEIRVELARVDGTWLELTVENEGDPLPEDKSRIFEAFVTSQKHVENLGLGLFVAQSIVRNHGGEIKAEDLSDAGGARFVVRLPESPANAIMSASERASASGCYSQSLARASNGIDD